MAETKSTETKSAETKTKVEPPKEKLVTIRLPVTKENQSPMFVRVNERTWLIPRGVSVEVPPCVVEVINNSERAILEGIEYQAAHEKDD